MFIEEDYRDLMKLSYIIEKKEHYTDDAPYELDEGEQDRSHFTLDEWFFNCGMPACVGGHSVFEFPERYGVDNGADFRHYDFGVRSFAAAFNLSIEEAEDIVLPSKYEDFDSTPGQAAARIREIAKRAKGNIEL